jgi:hypothetical protein
MPDTARELVPAPRLAADTARRPLPLRLPFQLSRPDCRPVIGDALLLQYTLQRCSTRYMPELTVRQARNMLAAWTAEQDAVAGRRDEVVRTAVAAGLTKSEVHRLTGIARTTIDRIMDAGHKPTGEGDAR